MSATSSRAIRTRCPGHFIGDRHVVQQPVRLAHTDCGADPAGFELTKQRMEPRAVLGAKLRHVTVPLDDQAKNLGMVITNNPLQPV